jgi:SAM-dependent methyltransferase
VTAPYERPEVAAWLAGLPIFHGEYLVLHHVRARENPVVLDVGAGAGRLTGALRSSGCRYLALDPSRQQLRTLQERNPGATAARADATALPIAAESVDVVVMAFHVIEAILPGSARDRAIAEASRVLRPGGWLCLSHHVRWRYRPLEMTRQWLERRVIGTNSAVEYGDLRLTGAPATRGVSFDGLPMHIPAERALRAAALKAGFLPRLRVPLTAVSGRWPASRLIARAVVRGWEKRRGQEHDEQVGREQGHRGNPRAGLDNRDRL